MGQQEMTQLLEKALAELNNLPPEEQDAMAGIILAELEDEQRWAATFAGSQDVLARLAADARRQIEAGQVSPGGFDRP